MNGCPFPYAAHTGRCSEADLLYCGWVKVGAGALGGGLEVARGAWNATKGDNCIIRTWRRTDPGYGSNVTTQMRRKNRRQEMNE